MSCLYLNVLKKKEKGWCEKLLVNV